VNVVLCDDVDEENRKKLTVWSLSARAFVTLYAYFFP